MNVFGWLGFQASATLPSGGIDVVAIRHADSSLTCSPFHVKLGKTCKKGEKRLVKLRVNGQEVDVCMRLGPAGEAFFLKRIKEVPPRERDAAPSPTVADHESAAPTKPSSLEEEGKIHNEETEVARVVPPVRARSLSECPPLSGAQERRADWEGSVGEGNRARERSASDMAQYACLLPPSMTPPLDSGSTTLSSSLVQGAEGSEAKKPGLTRQDESWVWQWGALPVKSPSLPLLAFEAAAQDKRPPSPSARRLEMRETGDEGLREETPRAPVEEQAAGKGGASGGLEYRPGQPEEPEDLNTSVLVHSPALRSLSLCAPWLSTTALPPTLSGLLAVWREHAVSAESLETRPCSALRDPDLCVLADGFLLTAEAAQRLQELCADEPVVLDAQRVEALVEGLQGASRPVWLGWHVSRWPQLVARLAGEMAAASAELASAKELVRPHLSVPDALPSSDHAALQPFSLQPTSDASEEPSLSYLRSIGWREACADLALAVRLQKQHAEGAASDLHASPDKAQHKSQPAETLEEEAYFHTDLGRSSEEMAQGPAVALGNYQGTEEEPVETAAETAKLLAHVEDAAGLDIGAQLTTDHADCNKSLTDPDLASYEEEDDHISLQDVAFEDISPEPADGDFYESDTDSYLSLSLEDDEDTPSKKSDRSGGATVAMRRRKFRRYRYKKVLVPSSEQLQLFHLKDGKNELAFELDDCPPLIAQLFVWPEDAKVVVTDIEGVLTSASKPSAGGWGSWFDSYSTKASRSVAEHIHDAVNLFRHIHNLGYRILYISNTVSMTSSSNSSNYSHSIMSNIQNNLGQRLPEGPVFKSPDSLMQAFGPSRTDVFKAAALRGLRILFPSGAFPYHAAFISKESDVRALERNGFPDGRIFLADGQGGIKRILLNRNHTISVKELQELVAQIFPRTQDGKMQVVQKPLVAPSPKAEVDAGIKDDIAVLPNIRSTSTTVRDEGFTDVTFWRIPLPVLEDFD
eukprot:gene30556-36927_t